MGVWYNAWPFSFLAGPESGPPPLEGRATSQSLTRLFEFASNCLRRLWAFPMPSPTFWMSRRNCTRPPCSSALFTTRWFLVPAAPAVPGSCHTALSFGPSGHLSLSINYSGNALYAVCSSQLPLHLRTQLHMRKISLHPPVTIDGASTYSSLLGNIPPPIGGGARLVPILPYKHASKWNSTVNKHHEPFAVAFNPRGMIPGYGVQHEYLVYHSTTILDSMIIRGGEPVGFPSPGRKIQFRIVVCCSGRIPHRCNNS